MSPLVAAGRDEDERSETVQRVPVGDKVVQWVSWTGRSGTDKAPCTAVTFNQRVLNCGSRLKKGVTALFLEGAHMKKALIKYVSMSPRAKGI